MKIKICGITNIYDARLAVECRTDAIGFIFYKKSKRYISPDKAKEIITSLPSFVLKMGVFVNEEINVVNEIAMNIGLNAVQLHGEESLEYCRQVILPVIKVFKVTENFDYSVINEYSNYLIMLDTYSSKEVGGTGTSFNWDKIPYNVRSKIVLSGGISENNIEEIFTSIKPFAVDLSSSLEKEPGIKDHDKVKSFFRKFNTLKNIQ